LRFGERLIVSIAMKSPNWTREQLIQVLALYCQIPLGGWIREIRK